MSIRILVVDDDAAQGSELVRLLEGLGYAADSTTSPLDALRRTSQVSYSAVLLDLGMEELPGLTVCERLLEAQPDLPVLVVTGDNRTIMAVGALRAGAYDYLTKPVDVKRLATSVARATHRWRIRERLRQLSESIGSTGSDKDTLLGDSPSMMRVRQLMKRVAASEASVLIQGETGTGKELVARAIHAASERATGPFVAINCASVPPTLLESELFGHSRGAFTDAKEARKGMFLEAEGGTLLLDEIGDMPLELQSKLLRALQERTIRPVGSNNEVPFDARIFAATHKNLEEDVERRRFRRDLFYRINVVSIDVPPLRHRAEDILTLSAHFLQKFSRRAGRPPVSLSPVVAERLLAYEWPGNVRELENCMERVSALARFETATLEDLPEPLRAPHAPSRSQEAEQVEDIIDVDELERRHILGVLERVDGNKARASQLLGVDRRTLYRKLARYRKSGQFEGTCDADQDGSDSVGGDSSGA